MEKGHDRYPDGAVRRLPIRMEIRTAEVAWIANQARIGVDLLGNLVFSGAKWRWSRAVDPDCRLDLSTYMVRLLQSHHITRQGHLCSHTKTP
jgi:hypothetical protein